MARRARPKVGRLVILGLVVVLVVAGVVAVRSVRDLVTSPRCQATALKTTVTFDPEQMSNAATITAIALKRGLPARAATIAIATAIQESKLRNIRYGDRDSLGLFQQRSSQGWGTPEQILDPEYATNAFYDALVKIDGYEQMEITQVAQAVQRSAYPEAYADHEQEGRTLASTIAGHSPAGLGCRLEPAPSSADVALLQRLLTAEYGLKPTDVSAASVTLEVDSERLAWSVGQWAVAKAVDTDIVGVTVGGRTWTRASGADGYTWEKAGSPVGATTVVIHLR